jgi:RHS repeat-associated protein
MQQQPVTVSVMKHDGVGIAEGTGDMIAEIIGTDSDNAKAVFYLSNHRGDTLAAYRDTDTLVARYRYDAFGNQRTTYCVVDETENAPRYTFSTKEYLSDAKLYLYAYCVYDPVAGRWTQRAPIDYQDSLNLYQFCGNNPVNSNDADGRSANDVERVEQQVSDAATDTPAKDKTAMEKTAQSSNKQSSPTKEAPLAVGLDVSYNNDYRKMVQRHFDR